jgi:hypothetical protein
VFILGTILYRAPFILFFWEKQLRGMAFSNQEHCTTHAIVTVESIHGVCFVKEITSVQGQTSYSIVMVDGRLS